MPWLRWFAPILNLYKIKFIKNLNINNSFFWSGAKIQELKMYLSIKNFLWAYKTAVEFFMYQHSLSTVFNRFCTFKSLVWWYKNSKYGKCEESALLLLSTRNVFAWYGTYNQHKDSSRYVVAEINRCHSSGQNGKWVTSYNHEGVSFRHSTYEVFLQQFLVAFHEDMSSS